MIFKLTIALPEDILTQKLLQSLESIRKNYTEEDITKFCESIKEEPDLTKRIYILNYIHNKNLLTPKFFTKTYQYFLDDPSELVQWHCILYLGLYSGKGEIDSCQLNKFLKSSNGLVRAATCWTLTKLGSKALTCSFIQAELLEANNDDRVRMLLGAALYLLDPSPTSQGILFIRNYFYSHYYNQDEGNYYSDILLGDFGSSAELFAKLLWDAGITIVNSDILSEADLWWLVSKEPKE